MPRRVSLPGAAELFRPTQPAEPPTDDEADAAAARRARQTSGRVRHEEKITVYVSREELLALEQARLALRAYGFAVDRGRIVREAIAAAVTDLEEHAEDSELVRRLTAP